MQKFLKSKVCIAIIMIFLGLNSVFAQGDDPGGLDPDPGMPAPISDWLPYMIVMAIALLFIFSLKKKVANN